MTSDPKAELAADATAAPACCYLQLPDGGRVRLARWPSPDRHRLGSLLILEGLGEFIERYHDLAARYRSRGWQVFALDWRGQGRSDRFLSGFGGGHVPDFDILRDDLLHLWRVAVQPETRDGDPLVILAHSMGGLIVLKALLTESPPDCSGVVLSCPLLGLRTAPFPTKVAKPLAATLCRMGFAEHFAFGQKPYDAARHGRFEGNVMTGDPTRFADLHDHYRRHPETAVGGVTFGWVEAAFRAIDQVLTHPRLSQLDIPMLILSAPADRLIDAAPHTVVAKRLPHAQLRLYPESRHEPLMEVPAIRDRVLADIDRFLVAVTAAPSRA